MTPEVWSRLKGWFEEAMDAEPAEVERILRDAERQAPELAAELRTLLREHAHPTLRTNAIQVPGTEWQEPVFPVEAVGPYRILRELGRGGTGIVFLAERQDDEFHRLVALKLLRHAVADSTSALLFTRERRALAQLRHPNIAVLTDWGTTPEFTPWLALEYVEGVPIDQYCKSLGGPQILALFAQVCQAVQYAHQRLILHSDLKPANILVTAEGQVKLLDFGISRLLEDGVARHTMDMRFTPGYASPEQIQGEAITAASDVYALGLVLYELMVGSLSGMKPGQAITIQQLAQRASGEVPRTPGDTPGLSADRARFLRGDLDRVILHALEHDPQRRYPSVAPFLADIENFRAGYPISLRPPSFAYQTRKLVSRHRRTAAAAALALLALVILAVVATWEAYSARRQQLAAERRFRELQSLAHSVIFDLHDSIRGLPGATPARRTLVGTAMKYLDGLREEGIGDDALAMELAAGYFRQGYVQVGTSNQSLGDTPAGRRSFQAARSILEDQWRHHPTDRRVGALRFAVIYNLSMNTEDPVGGVELARRYAPEADAWRKADPASSPFQAAGLLHQAAGRTLRSSGDLEAALLELDTSIGIFTKLVDLSVDHDITQMVSPEVHKPQAWQDLSRTLALEAAVWRDMGRPREAAAFHQRAVYAILKVAELTGEEPLRIASLADHDWKANSALDEGRLDEAIKEAKAQFPSLDAINSADQANLTAQRDIAQARRRMGVILYRKGDHAGGLRELKAAAEAMNTVADRDPTYVANRFLQIATLNDYALAANSPAHFRQALSLIDATILKAPSRPDLLREQARAWAGLDDQARSSASWAEFHRRSPRFARKPEL